MITNKYEPQQKCRLGTVSKKLLGRGGRGGVLKPVLYDKNIHLSYQINVVAFRKAWRYVALFCKRQRHQNIHTCKVYLTIFGPRWWDSHSPNTFTYSSNSGEPLRSYWSTRSIRPTVIWSTQSTLTLKSGLRLYRSIRSTVSWSTQSALTLKSPIPSYRSIQLTVIWSTHLLLWRLHMIKAFIYNIRWTL